MGCPNWTPNTTFNDYHSLKISFLWNQTLLKVCLASVSYSKVNGAQASDSAKAMQPSQSRDSFLLPGQLNKLV